MDFFGFMGKWLCRQGVLLAFIGLSFQYGWQYGWAQTSSPQPHSIDRQAFQAWVDDYLARQFNHELPSSLVLHLQQMQPLARVIELDRKQPEFHLSFWEYMDRVAPPSRVKKAKRNWQKHKTLLNHVHAQYGDVIARLQRELDDLTVSASPGDRLVQFDFGLSHGGLGRLHL